MGNNKKSTKNDKKATASTYKVTAAVSGLKAPAKKVTGNYAVFSAEWDYPSACFDEKKKDRFLGVLLRWITDTDVTKTGVTAFSFAGKTYATHSTLSGIKGSTVVTRAYTGSEKKSDSFNVDRRKYYPFTKSTQTWVRMYKVTKATWNNKTKKWALSKSARTTDLLLADANAKMKKGTIFTKAKLQAFAKSKNPKGKVYCSLSDTYKKYIYHPYLYGVGVQVQGWNSYSAMAAGTGTPRSRVKYSNVPTQASYLAFSKPAAPTVAAATVAGEASSHTLTFAVTADADDGTKAAERYDTKYTLSREVGYYSGSKFYKNTSTVNDNSSRAKTFNVTRNPNLDMPNGRTLLSLGPGEYIRYTFTCRNRGFAGNSSDVKRTFTYGRPHDPTVKSISKQGQHYYIVFEVTGNNRYTKKYTLQRLANFRPTQEGADTPVDNWTDAQWRSAAASASGWTDVASIAPGELRSNKATFTDAATEAYADPFKRTYYRVRAENDIYGMDGRTSTPFVVSGFLRIPSASNQTMKIISACCTEDGKAIRTVVAFNKTKNASGIYNSNGTEMSWDTVSYAWSSTQPASSYDFMDDTVKPVAVTQERKNKTKLLKSANIPVGWVYVTYHIRGVTASETYYIKGRRFLKDTEHRESDSYGKYAQYSTASGAAATIEVKAKPKNVKLNAPEQLVWGKDLSVTWTYESESDQTEYNLMYARGTGSSASSSAKSLLSKKESAPYAVVPWSTVKGKIYNNSVYLAVKINSKAGWSSLSEIKTVKVVNPPKASLGAPVTVSSQPIVLTLGTDNNNASAVVRVYGSQVNDWGPMGQDNQANGTIVHTNKLVKPSWTAKTLSNGTKWYYNNYSLPVMNLKNGGSYTVEYTAVVDDTGLDSNSVDSEGNVVKQTATFTASFTEKLVVPSFYVVCDPIDVDHGGRAHISIMDTPNENTNCAVDLYRVTSFGAYPLEMDIDDWRNTTITDRFPTYSRREPCTYRLCIRSSNGVRDWADASYSMPGYCIRFDWGDVDSEANDGYNHLTLPYNLKWSDSWTKNARIELHMDGTYMGYWRGGVDHKCSMSTDIVKLTGAEQIARVVSLAQHAGPVLVRLPNGASFCANVDVNNLDVSYDSLVVAASFSAQEIRMVDQYSSDAAAITKGLYRPV